MAQLMLVNPRKRRKTKRKTKRRVRSKTVTRRTTKSVTRRRNPAARGMMAGIMDKQIIPAATAAAGALGLDVIYGFLPIPLEMKTGPMRHLVKGAGAIGLGMIAAMVVRKSTAEQMSRGALTVVMHSAMKEATANFMPNLQLGEYMDLGYVGPGLNVDDYSENGYAENGMGEYMNNDIDTYGI